MAISNPNSLFSAGNVALDSTPYLRIAMAQKARQQAVDEAAYRHYSELPDKLNSAGVRAQDWEDPNGNGGIANDIENTKRFFIENSKDIIKGGKASAAYGRMMQDNLRKIQASKATGKFELESGKSFFDGKHRYRENDLKVKDAVSKSMYDPNHYKDPDAKIPYSFSDFSVAAAPYTSQTEMAHNKNITNGILPDRDPNDKGVFDDAAKKVTYNNIYSPDKLKQIGLNAGTDAKNNQTLSNKYEDMLGNPQDIQRATAALQATYGKIDPTTGQELVADNVEKMAAGTKIAEYSQMKVPKTYTDVKSLQEWRDKDREDRQAFMKAENVKKEAGRMARTKMLTASYSIPDIYANVISKPSKGYQGNVAGIEVGAELVDVDDLTEQEKDDLLGKPDKYGVRSYQTIETGGKNYLKKKNGVLYDSENKPLDPDATFGKTFTRLKPSKEAEAKQKVVKGNATPQQQPKAAITPVKVKGKVR